MILLYLKYFMTNYVNTTFTKTETAIYISKKKTQNYFVHKYVMEKLGFEKK